jgi:hypothetical protein
MSEYASTIHGLRVEVNKVGGGTLGRAYDGEWFVTVLNGPHYIFDNANLHTGTPKTHREVAEMAVDFADEEIDREMGL